MAHIQARSVVLLRRYGGEERGGEDFEENDKLKRLMYSWSGTIHYHLQSTSHDRSKYDLPSCLQ
jgi:hypothetical protein